MLQFHYLHRKQYVQISVSVIIMWSLMTSITKKSFGNQPFQYQASFGPILTHISSFADMYRIEHVLCHGECIFQVNNKMKSTFYVFLPIFP